MLFPFGRAATKRGFAFSLLLLRLKIDPCRYLLLDNVVLVTFSGIVVVRDGAFLFSASPRTIPSVGSTPLMPSQPGGRQAEKGYASVGRSH